jgi:hypothetical protein
MLPMLAPTLEDTFLTERPESRREQMLSIVSGERDFMEVEIKFKYLFGNVCSIKCHVTMFEGHMNCISALIPYILLLCASGTKLFKCIELTKQSITV